MSAPFHLVIWIDRQSARLRALAHDAVQETLVRCNLAHDDGHSHHKAGTPGSGHAGIHEDFLKDVANAIGEAREILILGPAEAKTALKKFLEHRKPALAARIVGLEAMGHATGAEIDAFARRFFNKADRMHQPNE